jgi:hypothetical protein
MVISLPEQLLATAYRARNGELAWDRGNALRALRWAQACGGCVLGVEIWIPTTPGPTIPAPFVYAFEPRRISGESNVEFIDRANNETAEYVREFKWDSEDSAHHALEPYFNFAFDLSQG